jgi:tetratricopeptide (TPR) repeat protein
VFFAFFCGHFNCMMMKAKVPTWLVALALALGTALLYEPVLFFNFVGLDDQLYFDTHIRRGFSWASLRWCLTTLHGYLWHPLTWLSHTLDWQLFGAHMGSHHATNVALHILSSVMLFLLLRRLTGALWRSAVVAALFAWHPLHVESVAWIAERKDVLSALFWMLTLWAYVRYAEASKLTSSPNPTPNLKPLSAVASVSAVALAKAEAKAENPSPSPNFFYLLALAFFALGLMAKPMLVTLPFVMLLLDWWPLQRFPPGRARLSRALSDSHASKTAQYGDAPQRGEESRPTVFGLVKEKIPFCLLSILFSILTLLASRSAAASLTTIPLTVRLGNSVVSYFLYVAKLIWPRNMVILYPLALQWSGWQILGAALFLVGVSILALRLRRTRPYFLAGWLWYLGVLVPVIGLVQVGVEPMADRYSYLPSLGLFVMVCWGAFDLFGSLRHGTMVLVMLSAAALLAFALVTENQLQYWRNSETLFTHNLKVYPDAYFAHAAFAGYLYNSRQLERAVAESQRSIDLKADYDFAHTVLGESLLKLGKVDQALAQFTIALQLQPAALDAKAGYANALLAKDLPIEAERRIAGVLAADPDDPEAYFLMGQARLKQGDLTGARDQFIKAMSLVNRYSEAQFYLAVVLARLGESKDALQIYREAKNLPPKAPDYLALNNLAWTLAADARPELRDGAVAVQLATRARELDHAQQPVVIGTLAAAYAEAGRFDDAVAAAQQAHDLALAQGAKDVAARNLQLLEIYRSHHAYHETLGFNP